jgi:O-antigen/teichoic acid export membrane protein
MSTYHSFFKNNLVVLSGHLLIYAQGLILMPIIIKTIGITVYGAYGILVSIIGFVVGISSFGIGFRCRRFLPSAEESRERRVLFYPQFYCHFASLMLLSLGLILLYPTLDRIFFKGEVSFSIWLVFPYFIFYLLYSQTVNYVRYTHRINYFNFFTLFYACLNIALIFLFYSLNYPLTINVLFTIQIISSVSAALPLTIKVVREIGLRFILPSLEKLVEDIKLGFPLVLVYIVDFILNSSDRYIVAAFISVTAVGYYNSAYALGSFVVLLPKISGVVLPPFISKAVDAGNETEARIMVNYTIKFFLLAAIPFVVGSLVMSKPLLILLANTEVANNAFLVTPIVALGSLFYGLNIIFSNVLFVRLKTTVLFKMNLLAGIMNVGLNLLIFYFIPNILVAAISTFLSYFVAFIFVHRVVTVDWPIDYDLKTIFKSVAASLIMGIVLLGTSSWLVAGTLRLSIVMVEIIVGVAIYGVVLLLLRTFSSSELLKLKEFVVKGDRSVGK